MGIILLTSCGFITEEIQQLFLNSLPTDYKSLSVAIITTASPNKEKNQFAIIAKKHFLKMGFQKVDFIDIESDLGSLKKSDIVYINGGNPFTLLHFLKNSGAASLLKKKEYIIGVSAGALVLGPSIEVVHAFTPELNVKQLTDFSALNIVSKIIFPHYNREDLFPSSQSIEERITAYELKNNTSIHRLTDTDYLMIEK